jgi:hypothetical protein
VAALFASATPAMPVRTDWSGATADWVVAGNWSNDVSMGADDAALEEGVELVLGGPGQLRCGAGLGVSDEAGRVLLYQAVQGGLLGTMAFVVDWRAIRCRWGCRQMPCTRGSR